MNNKKLKSIAFSLGLAAITLTANNLNAQSDNSRGLLGRGFVSDEMYYSAGNTRGIFNVTENTSGGFTNGNFGEPEPEYPEVPLGGGIAILIGAGLGYVALKKKEDKQ
jgi:hypothetical protein